MLKLLSRKVKHQALVLYRGTLTPRPQEFAFLQKQGLDVKLAKEPSPGCAWSVVLRHKDWGEARLNAPVNASSVPNFFLNFSVNLTEREREEIRAAGMFLDVTLVTSKEQVLRDKKNLLRFVRAVMSDDAVGSVDVDAMLYWTRAALDDELAMAADLDVAALYCIHAVRDSDDDEGRCNWLHTHGLGELGGFDVDILNPSESVADSCGDLFRAMAFYILSGALSPSEKVYPLAHPDGEVRLVPVPEFDAKTRGSYKQLSGDSPEHWNNRSVLCNPAGGFLGRFRKVHPSTFLSEADTDSIVIHFSAAATEAMSQRARATVPMLSSLMNEMAEFKLPVLAKIGYKQDGSDQGEHMWFSVHGIEGDSLDATLESSPFQIERMKRGDRGLHAIDRLTEWAIISPFGRISPDSLGPLRRIREDKDSFRAMMAEFNREG